MEVRAKLASILKEQRTEYNRKTFSLFKSCAHWISENPDTETNLHVLDLRVLGENTRIYDHVGSIKFPRSSEWRSLFSDWISWLKDVPQQSTEVQQKVKQLETALQDPQTLEENPYYFMMTHDPEHKEIINLTFLENEFVMRYFANVTPNLHPSLIMYNRDNAVSTLERHGGIINLKKVETSFLQEPQDYPKFTLNNQEPQDFEPITRQDILDLAEEQDIDYEDIPHHEKVKWEIIHDTFSPSEDTIIPGGLAAEIHELGFRMENPAYMPSIMEGIRASVLHQNQISPEEIKTFFEKLHAKTGIKKLEEVIDFSPEIGTFINNKFANGIGYREGGLRMQYVYAELPREQSMEYFGDLLMQAAREIFFPREKKITKAFFGWIGRHLMKEFFPETQFSYDEHLELDRKDKQRYDQEIRRCMTALKRGIKGDLIPERVRKWFKEFDMIGEYSIPGCTLMESCANPLELFLHSLDSEGPKGTIQGIVGFGDEEGFPNFEHFKESILGSDEGMSMSRKLYLELVRNAGFKPEDINEGNVLKVYYESRKGELRDDLEWLRGQAASFFTSYFRFIRDQPYRAGYYCAQKQIDKRGILGNLAVILQTPEKELMKTVMKGRMNIYDTRDNNREYNSGYDWEVQMRQRFD
ncbi:hypothetical protein A3K73_03500 [Candidatus Pacearchaeota archaeon RBG_13_36_9]|nr:MAG: hypothetical protein A3K73_03500 [Candidatus Pacearchaeota archaeon RBG_13_36_9]